VLIGNNHFFCISINHYILATGLDSRMAGTNAMFGQGVYAAESSTKADQYAGKV
jgi:hypothetical protein